MAERVTDTRPFQDTAIAYGVADVPLFAERAVGSGVRRWGVTVTLSAVGKLNLLIDGVPSAFNRGTDLLAGVSYEFVRRVDNDPKGGTGGAGVKYSLAVSTIQAGGIVECIVEELAADVTS